jgi:hypothetical protein
MNLVSRKLRLSLLALGLLTGGAALAAGCGGEDSSLPTVDCKAQAIPTFANVKLLSDTCSGCHASTLTGADRSGAPATINFDKYDDAKAHAEGAVSEVYGGSMPPGGGELPADQKQELYLWALCGTPQ